MRCGSPTREWAYRRVILTTSNAKLRPVAADWTGSQGVSVQLAPHGLVAGVTDPADE
jgi:hypothetical protein